MKDAEFDKFIGINKCIFHAAWDAYYTAGEDGASISENSIIERKDGRVRVSCDGRHMFTIHTDPTPRLTTPRNLWDKFNENNIADVLEHLSSDAISHMGAHDWDAGKWAHAEKSAFLFTTPTDVMAHS